VYEVFVAEFFLTQTPADNVAGVYPTFLSRFPSLEAVDSADGDELEATIEPLGFQRMRTEALQQIANEHDQLPRDREVLRELPRVGPYVADATCSFALNEPVPILDRNVVRIYERVYGDEFPDGEAERRAFAAELLPDDGATARRYNLALLDFGALVCQKRDPLCEECPLADSCAFYTSGRSP
jgi:A/G-specific adenine glycosylase